MVSQVKTSKIRAAEIIISHVKFIFVSAILSCIAVTTAVTAAVINYTENINSTTEVALGYPVPVPVDSLTAVDGFRTYDSLHAYHQDLMLTNDNMRGVIVGQTRNGREIWAYIIGDADNVTNDGLPEPAMLINGGIHAREWQSPEVTTELIEQLLEDNPDNPTIQYLMDNVNIVIVPVLNIDGFQQTQRFPTEVTPTSDADREQADLTNPFYDPLDFAVPRDGRMRRKNMPNVDENLLTEPDRLLGVDLNRNSNSFWGVQTGNSDPESLIYGGLSPASEPEIQALLSAGDLGPANQLRFMVDVHSFSRVLFMPLTSNPRQNASSQNLANKFAAMSTFLGSRYEPIPGNPGSDIPTTSTFFAFTYDIPAWTLEIEPPSGFPGIPSGGAFYGGNGISHDGFILPESEIARVRDELAPQNIMGFYHQAGPANVQAVQVIDKTNGNVVYDAQWITNAQNNTRTLQVNTNEPLTANTEYSFWMGFNKPMKTRIANGSPTNSFMGLNGIATSLRIVGNGDASTSINTSMLTGVNLGLSDPTIGWLGVAGGAPNGYSRYPQDALLIDFQVPATLPIGNNTGTTELALQINVQDITGLNLDGDPATAVGWGLGNWSGLEDVNGVLGVTGGADPTIKLLFDNAGQATTAPPPPPPPSSSGGGGSFGFFMLIILFFRKKT